jgi:hypothetical protein
MANHTISDSGVVVSRVPSWSVPARIALRAPYSILIVYQHPTEGERRDWFDSSQPLFEGGFKRLGEPANIALVYKPEDSSE